MRMATEVNFCGSMKAGWFDMILSRGFVVRYEFDGLKDFS